MRVLSKPDLFCNVQLLLLCYIRTPGEALGQRARNRINQKGFESNVRERCRKIVKETPKHMMVWADRPTQFEELGANGRLLVAVLTLQLVNR